MSKLSQASLHPFTRRWLHKPVWLSSVLGCGAWPSPQSCSDQFDVAVRLCGFCHFLLEKFEGLESRVTSSALILSQQSQVPIYKLPLPSRQHLPVFAALFQVIHKAGEWELLENILGAGCYCEKTIASLGHVLLQFSPHTENWVRETLFSFIHVSEPCPKNILFMK